MVVVKIDEVEQQRITNLPYNLPKKIAELLDFFKFAVNHKNTSVVLIVDGRSGMGKTTLSSQMGMYCDKDFSLKNFYFTPEDFLDGLSKAEKGDFILFDEAMLLSSRNALSEINKMCIIAMSMIRSKQIFVCFCVNSIFDLDRNIALSRADVLFSVYGMHLIDRGSVMAFFKGEDGLDRLKDLYLRGKKYYSYSHPKSNFNCNFSKHFAVNEEEYERLKQEGVNRFLGSSSDRLGSRDKRIRDILVKWIYHNTELKQNEIQDITGLSRKTMYNILQGEEKNNETPNI